jgi:hypothetical protein
MFFFKKKSVLKQLPPPVNDPHDSLTDRWQQPEDGQSGSPSWQQVYWGMMYRSSMKNLPEPMQDALFKWWDALVPREDEREDTNA